jgi:bifunctional oligoribonuclease and PAP phosphatase NrnA
VTEATGLLMSEAERDGAFADAVAELRAADKFLLTTHENPDGDALGSLLAMHRALQALGKDSVMFMCSKEFPLPVEYRFLPLEEVFHEAPADLVDRVLVFLDCGNIDRMPVDWLQRDGARVLNIDHHHDNTRFGTINLVDVEASSTAEIVYELVKELGVELTPEIALALYVGLVTDTGRFMYENTTPKAHRIAAELVEAGVDVDDIYRRLYERVPLEKLRLTSRALDKVERVENGALAIAYLTSEDYRAAGASEVLTEGIIDYLRALEGACVAALVRDKEDGPQPRKVSLRSVDGKVDVSRIAREKGGGGHARAAGFSTELEYPELVEFLSAEVRAQL